MKRTHCQRYAWKIVGLAASVNHISWFPNFLLITLKFILSFLKENSRQILNKRCKNNICQQKYGNELLKKKKHLQMSAKFLKCYSSKYPYIWFKISTEPSVICKQLLMASAFQFLVLITDDQSGVGFSAFC